MDGFRFQQQCQFTTEDTGRQQEQHAKDVVVKDHPKLGQFHILRRELHVEDVAGRGEAVCAHPKQTGKGNVDIVPSSRDGTGQHHTKGHNDKRLGRRTKEVKVSDRHDNVGDVLEDGHHRDTVEFKRGHSSEEHQTEQNVDGSPKLGSAEVELGVLDPLELLAHFDANDGRQGLEDNKKHVEVSTDEMVVTV